MPSRPHESPPPEFQPKLPTITTGQAADASSVRLLAWLEQGYFFDVAELYDAEGFIKPVSLWPEQARRMLVSLELGLGGRVVKFKLMDRLGAGRLFGRELGLFKQTVEVNHTLGLADRMKDARARVTQARPAGGEGGDFASPTPPPGVSAKILKIAEKAGPDGTGSGSAQAAGPAGCPSCRGEVITDGYNAGRFVHEEGCPLAERAVPRGTTDEREF